ncbi:MAG: glycosyltransferase [Phycisphaerales bacterium]|nr:MAG: glycosyltransferase [Phycisphaerales bacterium]
MKASVLIVTYNQEAVIGQTVESVLTQVTDFDYEIVIAEDCSSDHTRAIVCEYRDRFPDRIRLLLREQNLGLMRNLPQSFLECRGQYVACLDGDDYWTSPHKLQSQVDFLDAHPDCSICFHNALMVWDDAAQPPVLHSPPGRRPTYTVDELLTHDFISTSAAVVRNHLVREFPSWFTSLPVPDWPFFVLHAMHGKIGYLDEDWSVYRQGEAGAYCRLAQEKRMEQNVNIIRVYRDALGPEWRSLLTNALHSRCLRLALYYRQLGNKRRAKEFARFAVRESGPSPLHTWRAALKVFMYMHLPGLAGLIARHRGACQAEAPVEPAHQNDARSTLAEHCAH